MGLFRYERHAPQLPTAEFKSERVTSNRLTLSQGDFFQQQVPEGWIYSVCSLISCATEKGKKNTVEKMNK
jgi:hypothetical protein